MKFELNPYNRDISNDAIIQDIKAVAKHLSKNTLSKTEYTKGGLYSYSTIERRFGTWNKALAASQLDLAYYPIITDDELLNDLKVVATKLGKNTLLKSDYDKNGKYSYDSARSHFGAWNTALLKAGLDKSVNKNVTADELYENMEQAWTKLGRQPSPKEMTKPISLYSLNTYIRRFGSWRNALESFVKQVGGEEYRKSSLRPDEQNVPGNLNVNTQTQNHKTKRDPNWRLRFLVIKRDNFKCRGCGRSPASDPSIILHVDHIKAWANGGETVFDNLQTLCSICNIGKSNLE